ncbi:VOC family protein [Heyndrickxia sp. NPDC080065]|uniref:VOC family protein n=1 Tax=Heyndrickxia sp. NPDC080065 TaxID=3390568 RepID=UPI003D08DFE9
MKLSFDHLVHLVNQPEEAIEAFAKIGLKAFLGGRHENWGTYNALSYFGLSYIEFLGIFDNEKANKILENDLVVQAAKLLPGREGFARIALRTNDMAAVVNSLTTRGINIIGPIKGERKREDGITLKWQMLFINDGSTELPLPFIIQWGEEDEIRQKDIDAIGTNSMQLHELVFAVNNHIEAAEKWCSIFQLKKSDVYKNKKLKSDCIQIELEGCNLVFASPSGQGEMSRILESSGEGPCLLRISNDNIVLEREIFGGRYQFV